MLLLSGQKRSSSSHSSSVASQLAGGQGSAMLSVEYSRDKGGPSQAVVGTTRSKQSKVSGSGRET